MSTPDYTRYCLLKLQRNRQWYNSFVPLGSIKFTANEWYKRFVPWQTPMYALGAQSGTNDLYHSWAGLAATINNHGAQQDSGACFANNLGKAQALPKAVPYMHDERPCASWTSNE